MLRGNRSRPVILMYHRIARPPVDPWGLAVSPDNFRSQLQALKRSRTPLAMDEFVARLERGSLPANAVALTFDDGYLDNLEQAKPVLEAEQVPATVLVTTGWVGSEKLFWWDELTRLILLAREPIAAQIEIEGETVAFDLGPADDWEPRQTWRTWEPARSEREKLYHDLWTRLQRLDDAERERLVARLSAALGEAKAGREDRVMTRAELATLRSPMVEMGVHAVTHQPLTSMPIEKRRREISESLATCEEIAGTAMTGFAYPHGDLDPATARVVAEMGFAWAVSTESAAVDRGNYDRFALPRIMATDVPGDRLLNHIAHEAA